ncbi:hypothetical protein FTX61_02870 [Nitriliruptoraceae bacterium ZYF776]|nr:hypothetical protein [Profundirhabdus halotolerans]
MTDEPTTARVRRYPVWVRQLVILLALARYVIPIGAIAFIPAALQPDVSNRFLYLFIGLRPGREVMLLTGYRYRIAEEPDLVLMFLAAFPFFVVATWVFFLLGRIFQEPLRAGTGPRWLQQLAPPERIEVAQRALARRGAIVAFLARIGGLPYTILGAAAGISDVSPRRYLVADALGAVVTFAMTVGIGFALGSAYERGGRWFTIGGLVVVAALAMWFSTWMQRELDREDAQNPTEPS